MAGADRGDYPRRGRRRLPVGDSDDKYQSKSESECERELL
jgi:hypothetical protein